METEQKKMPKKKAPKKAPSKKKVKQVQKKGQEKILSVLKTVCIISVVLVLLVIAAQRFGDVTFSSVGDYFNTMIAGAKSGDGYPYHFENMNVKKLLQMDRDLLVLTDDETFVLDNTARTIGKEKHSFSAPIAYTKAGRTLLIDVGGEAYRVLSKTKVLYDGVFPQKLLNGAISKEGSIALSSRGDQSQTKLTVLNKQRKEVFVWNCATENILSVAISDNGKKVAASVLGATDGELYSKVYLFDISKENPILSLEYPQVISNLEFLSGNRLLITGKKVFEIYDGKEKVLTEDLSVNTFSKLYLGMRDYTFASFAKYGSASAQIVKAYDRKGKVLFQQEINENVKGVSTDSLSFSVLTDNYIYTYNRDGEQIGKIAVEAGCIAPFTDGKYVYVWTVGGIERYKNNYISTQDSQNEEKEFTKNSNEATT